MKHFSFFRKYAPFFGLVLLFYLLIFILIPGQEKHYEQVVLKSIAKRILWLSMAVSLGTVVLIWFLKIWRKEKLTDALYTLVNLIFIAAIAGYFLLRSIFSFTALLLNRMYVKEKITRQYSLLMASSNKERVILSDPKNKEVVLFEHLVHTDLLGQCDTACSVMIMTRTGLFGWESDPEIFSVN